MTRFSALVSALLLVAGAAIAAEPEVPVIHASFSAQGGERDVRDVRLWVDGQDVTSNATVTPLRVSYAPPEPLKAGQHSARVVVTDSLGRTWTKEWTFDVAAAAPVLEEVWSDALLVELARLPRQTPKERLAVTGFTQPAAEVVVRVDGAEVARTLASASGRFRATVPLEMGDHAVSVVARRLDTGAEGPEVVARVNRLSPVIDRDDTETAAWRPPGFHARPELVSHRGGLDPRAGDLKPVVRLDDEDDDDASGTTRPPGAGRGDHAGGARPPAGPGAPGGLSPDPLPGDDDSEGGGDDDGNDGGGGGGSDDGDDGTGGGGDDEPAGEVVITKPDDGQVLEPGHVTVLGRAPAGWRVVVRVDGSSRGSDVANPAGHFTVPRVQLGEGAHELVAEAESEGRLLVSEPVRVEVASTRFMLAAPALSLLTPVRGATVVRGNVQRVSGTAWDGAEVEVDVNGRIVARDVAGLDGRFDIDAPLEPGLNVLLVEASSPDGSRVARSREMSVTATGRTTTVVRDPHRPGERPGLPPGPRLSPRLPGAPQPRPAP